jgi:hypothetical protein
MWAVPIYVGRIFDREITQAGNHVQEVSAALHAEYVFILLGVIAFIVSVMLFRSSRKL